MKKLLHNKTYNTKTAKWCGEFWNGYDSIDVEYVTEDLYLKKTGEFFLHVQTGGRQICKPLSYEEAREWAEERLTAGEYECIFGETEENDGWTPVHVYVKNNLVDEIKKEKQTKRLSLKDIVNAALDGYFDR